MKGIVVTEKNYNMIAGKLKKFFSHRDFIVWHNFDCGMKKRISHKFINICGNKIDVMRQYSNVSTRFSTVLNKKVLVVDMSEDESFALLEGDEIMFLGNRILIKGKFAGSHHKLLYQCFQINK